MAESTALVPVEQKEVEFYEDTIVAVRLTDGSIQVPIRPICDNLGVTLAGQRERINRDPVLSEEVTSVSVTLTQQAREMLCLPLKFIPGWLFGISANRVKPGLRDRIIRYQRECYDVLWEAFEEGRLTTTGEATFDELLQRSDSDAVEAYKMLQAMVKLARNQVLIEARLDHHDSRLGDYETRLEAVESVLGDPGRHVTPEQASQISQAVKAIAMKLSDRSGRNEYGGVYGELYRRFGIASYKELPANQFDAAMDFLNDWHARLTGTAAF
jgi:hypothetical protein